MGGNDCVKLSLVKWKKDILEEEMRFIILGTEILPAPRTAEEQKMIHMLGTVNGKRQEAC